MCHNRRTNKRVEVLIIAVAALSTIMQACEPRSIEASFGVPGSKEAASVVTITPTSPSILDLLTCTVANSKTSLDAAGKSITYIWYRNKEAVSRKSVNTLDVSAYKKGDEIRCDAEISSPNYAPAVAQSAIVVLQNSLPTAPASVSIVATAPNKTGQFSCSYLGGRDPDRDPVTPKYLYKIDGSVVAGETATSLAGSNEAVIKGKKISCAVALSETKGSGKYTESEQIVVENSPTTGTVTCSGAAPLAIGRPGETIPDLTCTGATDLDGSADFAYELTAISGTCPSLPASGLLSGATFGAPGSCSYTVRACDSKTCTASSPTYTISSYSLAMTLETPSLASDCALTFAGTTTASSNLSNLVYGETTGLSGAVASASGISVLLSGAAHMPGTYEAIWNILQGDIGSIVGTNSVLTAASPVGFSLTKTLSSTSNLQLITPTATLAGSTHQGRQQIPSHVGGCLSPGSGTYATIAAGNSHVCVVSNASALKCWGGNSNGQLGIGNWTTQYAPKDVYGLSSGIASVAPGRNHTCAVTTSGGVKCWGNNGVGQLGTGTTVNRNLPSDVSALGTSEIVQLALGPDHTCVLNRNGAVKCWGANAYGQLGNGTLVSSSLPSEVAELTSGVSAISSKSSHTCALTSSGGAKCWGYNNAGQLGDGTVMNKGVPVDVVGLTSGVAAIAVGGTFWDYGHDGYTCALTTVGGVKCWGFNGYGQLGDGTTVNSSTPVSVAGLTGVVAIAPGVHHACALTSGGVVKCWGANSYGQLGDGTKATRSVVVDVIGMASGVVALTAGFDFSCAIMNTGATKCWGTTSAPLGDNFSTKPAVPVTADLITSNAATVGLGSNSGCMLTGGGGIRCWGDNNNGQIGDGTTLPRVQPTDVSGLASGVASFAQGHSHTCALTTGGGVKCWGANYYGQLGDATTILSSIPVDVSGLTSGVSAIAIGGSHTCALTTGGGVKCWGQNIQGQLGDSSATTRLTPVDVTGLAAGVTAITAGDAHTCAILAGGAAQCWGYNSRGRLGDTTTTNRSAPVAVNGLGTGVSAISAGSSFTCALLAGGGVKCWGDNAFGQIGDGTTVNKSVPTDVSGLTSGVAAIALRGGHVCVLTTEAGIKCWGYNTSGQLGDGTYIDRYLSQDVPGLTSGVAKIIVGSNTSCAALVSGSLKCWGDNSYAQVGSTVVPNALSILNVYGLSSLPLMSHWIFGVQ